MITNPDKKSSKKNPQKKIYHSWQEIVATYPINLDSRRKINKEEEYEIFKSNYFYELKSKISYQFINKFNIGEKIHPNSILSISHVHEFLRFLVEKMDLEKEMSLNQGVNIDTLSRYSYNHNKKILDYLHKYFYNFFNLWLCINRDEEIVIYGRLDIFGFMDFLEENYEHEKIPHNLFDPNYEVVYD